MENITLGQLLTIITFIITFIGSMATLITFSRKFIKKILNPINEKIDQFQKDASLSRNNIELELIKVILANFINDLENGVIKSQIEMQNAYELYDRYLTLGGNSYIQEKWKKLQQDGQI